MHYAVAKELFKLQKSHRFAKNVHNLGIDVSFFKQTCPNYVEMIAFHFLQVSLQNVTWPLNYRIVSRGPLFYLTGCILYSYPRFSLTAKCLVSVDVVPAAETGLEQSDIRPRPLGCSMRPPNSGAPARKCLLVYCEEGNTFTGTYETSRTILFLTSVVGCRRSRRYCAYLQKSADIYRQMQTTCMSRSLFANYSFQYDNVEQLRPFCLQRLLHG